MKPNFALDLSHDGIGLLHRGADGWHLVGSVSLEDAEFNEELAYLRRTAAALEPGGVTTKLVIPNTQILFTAADAPGPTDAERTTQIRSALDGLTPYDISDLIYDWTTHDGAVMVAAIARETLEEAESFAVEHGFNPVSFVAKPAGGVFASAEPFFGPSRTAATLLDGQQVVERDRDAIRVLGPASHPEPIETIVEDAIAPHPEGSGTPPVAQVETPPEPTSDPPPDPEPLAISPAPLTTSVTAPQLLDLEAPAPKTTAPEFSSKRSPGASTTDNHALERIEKIESRLAILPDGTASLAPMLGGVSRRISTAPPPATTPAAKPQAIPPQEPVHPAVVAPTDTVEVPATAIDQIELAPASTHQPVVESDEQAMTVFGARKKTPQRGKPRHLGLGLMLVLLAVFAAIILWSTYFLGDTTAFWRNSENGATDVAQTGADGTNSVNTALSMLTEPSIRRVASDAQITEPAPLELAQSVIAPAPIIPIPAMTPEVAQAAYLDSGIWQLAPQAPLQLRHDSIDTLYIPSIDPQITSLDAIALPSSPQTYGDVSLDVQSSPVARNTAFILDENGLVIPSVDGTMTPSGVMVFAGPPPTKPKPRGNQVPQVPVVVDNRLAKFKPAARPANLVAQTKAVKETESLGGYTRVQLAALRPQPRPFVVSPPQHINETEPAEVATTEQPQKVAPPQEGPTSELAVVLSSAPKHRPRNFARVVERARATAPTERATAATAVPKNQTVAPGAPTRASVARLATTKNAINLRRTSLIGIYGSPSKRRALVRLSSGRYVKVTVGQRVDGGKVAAIGQSELRYVKGGRTIVLRMPKS